MRCEIDFLDHRFTILAYPSRLLSYMQAKLPVLACTDKNTDIGKIIIAGEFGWWCESKDQEFFHGIITNISCDMQLLKANSHKHLLRNYQVCDAYEIIMNSIV